eukprot:jgi/Galph1/5264/GphlegSOOS_G3975.1
MEEQHIITKLPGLTILWLLIGWINISVCQVLILEDNFAQEEFYSPTVEYQQLLGEQIAPDLGLFDKTCPARFGYSIAANSEGTVAIGTPGRDAVLLMEPVNQSVASSLNRKEWVVGWKVDTDLHPEDVSTAHYRQEHFGRSIAFYQDMIAIASKRKVYIFKRSMDKSRWDPQGIIDGTSLPAWHEEATFGKTISFILFPNNQLGLVITAPRWPCYQRFWNPWRWSILLSKRNKMHYCGVVFIYQFSERQDKQWKLVQTIYPPDVSTKLRDTNSRELAFGESILTWDPYHLIVGCPGATCLKRNIERTTFCGSIFVYYLDKSNKFRYVVEFQATDLEDDAYFGASLALLNNGTIAVGAPGQDCIDGTRKKSDCGTVYIVTSEWSHQEMQLMPLQKCSPSSQLNSFDQFGFSLASSKDGNLLLISAPGRWSERGCVFLFKKEYFQEPAWLWGSSFSSFGWQLQWVQKETQSWWFIGAPFTLLHQGSKRGVVVVGLVEAHPQLPLLALVTNKAIITLNAENCQEWSLISKDKALIEGVVALCFSRHMETSVTLALITSDKRLLVFVKEHVQDYTASYRLRQTRQVGFQFVRAASVESYKELLVADKSGIVHSISCLETDNPHMVEEEDSWLGHYATITDLCISSDGKYVITSDRDNKIRISEYPNTYRIHSFCLRGSQCFVTKLCTCRLQSQEWLLSIHFPNELSIWDWNGHEKKRLGIETPSYIVDASAYVLPSQWIIIGMIAFQSPQVWIVTLQWNATQDDWICLRQWSIALPGIPSCMRVDNRGYLWLSFLQPDTDASPLLALKIDHDKIIQSNVPMEQSSETICCYSSYSLLCSQLDEIEASDTTPFDRPQQIGTLRKKQYVDDWKGKKRRKEYQHV